VHSHLEYSTHYVLGYRLTVKSRSTLVGGPVKSGRKRTRAEVRGLGRGYPGPELQPIGFNDKDNEH